MHKRRIHSAPHGHTTLRDWRLGRTPAPRRRRMSNYAINLAFLETYARENGYGLDGASLHAMGGPKRLLPQERLRGLPRPGHLPRLRRAAGNVCGGDRPPRGQAPMAKPWQLRLLPKRGDGADGVGRRDGEACDHASDHLPHSASIIPSKASPTYHKVILPAMPKSSVAVAMPKARKTRQMTGSVIGLRPLSKRQI